MDELEIWKQIPEFPDYEVSNYGRIAKIGSDRPMRMSFTGHGHGKISLLCDGDRRTRSVALLVAQAFVEPPNELCDTVMVLNRHFEECAAYNLVWRPAWFVQNYSRQFKNQVPIHFQNLPITNVTRGINYPNIIETAMAEGLLFKDIWVSTYSESVVWPVMCQYVVS